MTRTAAREVAVRLCFSADLAGEEINMVIADFFEPEHYETLGKEDPLFSELPDEAQMTYIRQLVQLVFAHKEELDEQITKYAKGWTVSRISRITLTILRCAMCEMLYVEDVPAKAAINEAVEIAKRYEEPETVRFINGILGSFERGDQETT